MNSPLATYTNLTDHNSGKRTAAIDRITPHCIVGQWSSKQCCDYFVTVDRRCSSNYVVGTAGDIGVSVDEDNCSWCSSSSANDQRAVTIECASDKTEPYAMTDAVYKSLVNLCVDICQRHGKTKLLWIEDKEKALVYKPAKNEMLITVHKWFSATMCPGEWLYSRLGKLAEDVTKAIGKEESNKPEGTVVETLYCVQVGAYKVYKNATNMLDRIKKSGYTDAYITTKEVNKSETFYFVQVGSYKTYKDAESLLNEIRKSGYADAYITNREVTKAPVEEKAEEPETYYCVQVGAYKERKNAENMLDRIKKSGYTDAYITTKVIKK